MSWLDDKTFALNDPNYFKIGDVGLLVPPENIDISRHENMRSISYLRDLHAMKIHTGRSVIRVNVTFPVLVDRQIEQLQALVAMTRVTPFVPVQNLFLQNQIQVYDVPPAVFGPDDQLAKADKILAGDQADLFTEDGAPTFLQALPMAIMGMAVTMGGDSPEVAECSMSLVYWNPVPWFGLDLQYWSNDALTGLNEAYGRYILNNVDNTVSNTFEETTFRWWDIQLYSELRAKYSAELEQALIDDPEATPATALTQQTREREAAVRANEDGIAHFTNFDEYTKYMSNRVNPDQFVEGIAQVETSSAYKPDRGWDKVHPTTNAAGKYQMRMDTFKAIMFEGADTIDGVPLRDKIDPSLYGDDRVSQHMIGGNRPQHSAVTDEETFSKWYARPEMAEVQKYVATEYAKGLLKKHNGDSVSASLEYFMGAPTAKKYINEWESRKFVGSFKARDERRLGDLNATPRQYIRKFLDTFNQSGTQNEYATDVNRPIFDGNPSNYDPLTGSVPTNRHGDILVDTPPLIPPAHRQKLEELGWTQISVLANGRPNPSVINPLFIRTAANVIDMTADPVNSPDNQVVTSITVSFQNRFATLPLQGWPYPAMQHMGGVDSEIRMTVACLSESQEFTRLQQFQQMLHSMAVRARKYRSDIWDGREILWMTRVGCSNRLLNALGIKNVIVSDINIGVDTESTELARGEIIMSESAFDPTKENLTASLGKNVKSFRRMLREIWLANDLWAQSTDPTIRELGSKIKKLQKANDQSLTDNLARLGDGRALQSVVTDTFNQNRNNFRKSVSFSKEDEDFYKKQARELAKQGFTSLADEYLLRSAVYVTPVGRVLDAVGKAKPEDLEQIIPLEFSINPTTILTQSLGDKIGRLVGILYETSAERIINDPTDINRIDGQASAFLDTSFGRELFRIWIDIRNRPSINEFEDLASEFFQVLSKALHEWYDTHVLEELLLFLYRSHENDASFAELRARALRAGAERGVYKDLFLDAAVQDQPYYWLDRTVETKVESAIDELVAATSNRVDNIVQAQQELIAYEAKNPFVDARDKASARTSNDATNYDEESEAGARHKDGVVSAFKSVGTLAKYYANGLRYQDTAQFTMRRAFPAFRMYFVEEDNQGLFRRFDDFYNYNAITDIQIIKYKHRPAVMVVTMTNMFGHLDSKTFDDMADSEDVKEASRQALTNGRTAPRVREQDGVEENIYSDGTVAPLQEIMLKPGTKIVMKLGYNNDPNELQTAFAGQVTEVSHGDVMTIVCQDWTSELMAGATSGGETALELRQWWGARWAGTSSTWDLQGTVSTRAVLQAVLTHRSVLHFGHRQLKRDWTDDSNYFGYRKESSFTVQALDAVGQQIIPGFRIFSTIENVVGQATQTRAVENVHPETQPYNSAFGRDSNTYFLKDDEVRQYSLWEIVQLYRRLMPNHVALVRPYGQGDATLYFGPSWGVYKADDFSETIDPQGVNEKLTKASRDIFRQLIRNKETIFVAAPELVNSTLLRRVWRAVSSSFRASQAFSSQTVEMTIGEAVMFSVGVMGEIGAHGFQDPEVLVIKYGELNANATDAQMDEWYDLLMKAAHDNGGVRDDEQRHALLIDVLSNIFHKIAAYSLKKAYDDPDWDPDGSIRNAIKPTRKWHFVNTKAHIIANNIRLNSNFANEVRAHDYQVAFDRELTERRTLHADRAVPESMRKIDRRALTLLTSILAEEVQTMYEGEIILTGNPNIEPHDLLFIFDDVRHIHGAVEVAKVNHVFNMDMGFVTIVTPHLIVEQQDYSMSTALAAAMTQLGNDYSENSQTLAGTAVNKAATTAVKAAAATTTALSGGFNTKILGTFVLSQMFVPSEIRNHPLTIYPLTKRIAPWVAGIDGASGRGLLGVFNQKIVKGLKNTRRFIESVSAKGENIANSWGDLTDSVRNINKGGIRTNQDPGNFD